MLKQFVQSALLAGLLSNTGCESPSHATDASHALDNAGDADAPGGDSGGAPKPTHTDSTSSAEGSVPESASSEQPPCEDQGDPPLSSDAPSNSDTPSSSDTPAYSDPSGVTDDPSAASSSDSDAGHDPSSDEDQTDAGGSSDPNPGNGFITAQQLPTGEDFHAAAAELICSRTECLGDVGSFDKDACVESWTGTARSTAHRTLPTMRYDAEEAARCINAMAALTCDDYLMGQSANAEDCADVFRGSKVNGVACAFDECGPGLFCDASETCRHLSTIAG